MPHSPALPALSLTSRRLWSAALLLAPLASATAIVPLARDSPAATVACGAATLILLLTLIRLRAQHRSSASDAARYRQEARDREELSALRESQWRADTARQVNAVGEAIEHLVTKRLPAALALEDGPEPGDEGRELDPEVVRWLDLLLAEVSRTVVDREESRRLALVELTSRVQTSAHRIQGAMSGLAAGHPGDPDLLEATMRVDHAATQQARHAQSLKVLCGEWPGQQWQKPLAMVDVVRAASGRIVAFSRVEVTGDPDVGVAPSVVEPLIHLLAELLANATEHSPPRTSVPVAVRTVQRGAVIEVDDGGLGMDDYQLADAREIASGRRLLGIGEVGEIPRTGLAVVGRFADRHGFHVDLGPSPYGGIRAVILVPTEALETIAPAGSTAATRSARIIPNWDSLSAGAAHGNEESGRPASGPADRPAGPPRRPAPPADPAAPGRTSRGLPQRRSRRDDYTPAADAAAPGAATPPGTPEQAGDWMEQFFEGGRSVPPSGPVPPEGRTGGPPSPTPTPTPTPTEDSSEGQS
jgi:signal transduction histidine kinase